ncbi:hypothetical protein [Leptospira levettii]|uniref:hypothetical protein n=1 Tax=Leptospira levettii TaxID=2023178 RepID=UPI00223E8479|nr:hypothetical protein [Leptospira levettii]MCW7475581.1 hypothetical protein [Leptospira levettii]
MKNEILKKEERNKEHNYHLLFCQATLSLANKIFKEIQHFQNNSLSEYAFGYGLVQYAAPYTNSMISKNKKLKLKQKFIPAKYKKLHFEIMKERDKLHAHMDLSIFEPRRLSAEEINGVIYTSYASNYIIRFNLLSKLSEIIELVDGTLENLSKEYLLMEKEKISKKNT